MYEKSEDFLKLIAFHCKTKQSVLEAVQIKILFQVNLQLFYFSERLYITELDFSALADQNKSK